MTNKYNMQRNCVSVTQEFLILGYILIPESVIHRTVKNIYSDISRKPHNPGSSGCKDFFFVLNSGIYYLRCSNRLLLIAFNFLVSNIHNSCIIQTLPNIINGK
jgi:hypothetical protein